MTASEKAGGYGARALVGFLWTALSLVVTRGSGLVAHAVLGWVLTVEDFRLFGLAVVLISAGTAFHNGGVRPLLIQNGENFGKYAGAGMQFALLSAVATALVFALSAAPLEEMVARPGLAPLLWIAAASFVFQAPLAVYRAKMSVELRFRSHATLQAVAGLVRNFSMIIFALGGAGAAAFVWPYVVTAVFELILFHRVAGPVPRGKSLDVPSFCHFLHAGKWLTLGTFAAAMALHGEKIAVDRIAPQILGAYFFGSQLVAGFFYLLTPGISAILLPVFSRLTDDAARKRSAFLRSVRALSIGAGSICIGIALVASEAVQLLWQGKWDASIPIVQLLFVSLGFRLLAQLSLELIRSEGRWRLNFAALVVEALSLSIAAAVGASSGNLTMVGLWLCGQQILFGVGISLYSGASIGVPVAKLLKDIVAPAFVILLCAGIAYAGTQSISPEGLLQRPLVRGLVYVATLALGIKVLLPRYHNEVLQLVRPFLGGRRSEGVSRE